MSYNSALNIFSGSPMAEVEPGFGLTGSGLQGWAPCNYYYLGSNPLSGSDAIGDATCSWTFTPGLQNPCDPSTQSCTPNNHPPTAVANANPQPAELETDLTQLVHPHC
jgi:hypothetical protein